MSWKDLKELVDSSHVTDLTNVSFGFGLAEAVLGLTQHTFSSVFFVQLSFTLCQLWGL